MDVKLKALIIMMVGMVLCTVGGYMTGYMLSGNQGPFLVNSIISYGVCILAMILGLGSFLYADVFLKQLRPAGKYDVTKK